MSRERVSGRDALLRLPASSLSKRRWQDAVGRPPGPERNIRLLRTGSKLEAGV
jgi:hypothetical protein